VPKDVRRSRNYAALAPTAVRRRDRAVTDDAWIRAFLRAAPYGALATVHDGRPFLNSNLFVYDEARHAVYLHTARVGRTAANVGAAGEEGAPVCFSAFRMGRLLPADTALEFSVEYEGVVAFGRGAVVKDPEEARDALHLLLDKYAPHLRRGRDYRGVTAAELKRTAVYRVAIESWSGKRKEAPPDFPGAFLYGAAG
jgi:nitroimidazol reductase NimA-like FMN-containing flavoprotein (pyridoxamine 5'-phosphate oxidase superfamily)